MAQIKRKVIDPVVIPVLTFGLVILAIVLVGELLLQLYVSGDTPDRLNRPELWTALAASLVILIGMGSYAGRPGSGSSFLERDVAIGKRSFFPRRAGESEEEDEHVQELAAVRTGEVGAVTDVTEGYTLYAQSGAVGQVRGVLEGGTDHGKRFAGYLYATGVRGASREMWVPVEAVVAVYPETRAAILSIKGDEMEYYGWTIAPESIRDGSGRRRNTE